MQTIRELRLKKDWTQYDLALKVGVHPQAVYLWESGRRTPLVLQMRKLGQLFEMCSDDIVLETHTASKRGRRRRSASEEPVNQSTGDEPDTP